MLPPEIRCVVGIDVAKQFHVVCALEAPSGVLRHKATRIEATTEGYSQLGAWLQQWGQPETLLIGMEATGTLWEPLHDLLTRVGYQVLVLNPRQTSSWAASLGLRAKTDGIDAQTIARGLLAGYARASSLPSETIQALRTLTRARRDLIQSRTAARQRLQDELVLLFPKLMSHLPPGADLGTSAILKLLSTYSSAERLAQAKLTAVAKLLSEQSAGRWGRAEAQALQTLAQHSSVSKRAVAARSLVVRTLALHLLDVEKRIRDLERALAAALDEDEGSTPLQGVPGLGPVTKATIRAELGDVARFRGVDQVIAYAGLEPRTRQSGTRMGQKLLSKRGPGALRHALYLSVVVAVRCRTEWRERYQRLMARGRAKKEALTILSRVLLKIIYHLLRTGTRYDATRLCSAGQLS